MKNLKIKENGTVVIAEGNEVHCPHTLGHCSVHCAWCTIFDGEVWCKEWSVGVLVEEKK